MDEAGDAGAGADGAARVPAGRLGGEPEVPAELGELFARHGRQLVDRPPDAVGGRAAARVSPNKGAAPDVCDYTSAAHNLAANPSSAGMRDVQVDTVNTLGRQAFRETAYQTQTKQQLAFVGWNAGSRNWVLTHATATNTPSAPVTVSNDKMTGAARSITAKLPTGR